MNFRIVEFLRPEPILRLRPYVNPHGNDAGTEREWRLSVHINNARKRLRKLAEIRGQK